MASDMIQKATEWDKQAAKFKACRPLDTLHQTHMLQPKYDGCHMIVNTTTEQATSRTGEVVRSCAHIVAEVVRAFGPGWVVQGEAWMPDTPFPFISGKFRQHTPWPDMVFMAYDCLPVHDFERGRCDHSYFERHIWLQERRGMFGSAVLAADTCQALGVDVQRFANDLVAAGGYDGAILRSPTAPWVAGPCRNGELVKVKPSVSLDLRCVGWSIKPGEKTGREVVVLTVEYRDAETNVGSGIPHDLDPANVMGKIIEVECMAVNPNNTLREPRFKAVRYDKLEPDA